MGISLKISYCVIVLQIQSHNEIVDRSIRVFTQYNYTTSYSLFLGVSGDYDGQSSDI